MLCGQWLILGRDMVRQFWIIDSLKENTELKLNNSNISRIKLEIKYLDDKNKFVEWYPEKFLNDSKAEIAAWSWTSKIDLQVRLKL